VVSIPCFVTTILQSSCCYLLCICIICRYISFLLCSVLSRAVSLPTLPWCRRRAKRHRYLQRPSWSVRLGAGEHRDSAPDARSCSRRERCEPPPLRQKPRECEWRRCECTTVAAEARAAEAAPRRQVICAKTGRGRLWRLNERTPARRRLLLTQDLRSTTPARSPARSILRLNVQARLHQVCVRPGRARAVVEGLEQADVRLRRQQLSHRIAVRSYAPATIPTVQRLKFRREHPLCVSQGDRALTRH
jgi:hypothetical protein